MADSGACGSGQAGPRATSAPGPKTRRTFRTSRTGEPPAARSGSDSQISLFQPALLRASFVQRHLNVGGMEAEHRARLNRTIRRTSSRNGRYMSQRTGRQDVLFRWRTSPWKGPDSPAQNACVAAQVAGLLHTSPCGWTAGTQGHQRAFLAEPPRPCGRSPYNRVRPLPGHTSERRLSHRAGDSELSAELPGRNSPPLRALSL